MASIRPFSGLRYSSSAGDLKALVAPPYDVLSPEQREEYAARSPYNVVHLTLPEEQEGDRSKYVKYARSAADLAEWRRSGVLAPEPQPSFYRYTQRFALDPAGPELERTSLVALIHLEPYENGIVLPHEQTFSHHKEDRLRLLEATRAHLECIFGLYEDDGGALHQSVAESASGVAARVTTDDGVLQILEPISDRGDCERLRRAMADKKVWIADGHHRYETALAFRQAMGERSGEVAEDYMMMALASMSDPGLTLLPTHRMLTPKSFEDAEVLQRLGREFAAKPVAADGLVQALSQGAAHTFGLAIGTEAYLLTPRDAAQLVRNERLKGTERLKALDVSILHAVILEELLGVAGLERLSFTRDAAEALRFAREQNGVSFLMNPPTVEEMKQIALGGEKMPQKSTYYYPKITSGLVLWALSDFA